MAVFIEPEPAEVLSYERWLAQRPAGVRAVAERFRPWELYQHKRTGQRVRVRSFAEDSDGRITITMVVLAAFTPMACFDFGVFGVDPVDLEPCDVPADGGWS